MVIAYFDLETYSIGKEPTFKDKIILVCYKETNGRPILLREWISDEKSVISKFYDLLKTKIKTEKTVTIIGFNILRFDVPLLSCRLHRYKVDKLHNNLEFFRKIYWRDLRQCLLPFNKYRLKGLGAEEIAKKFNIDPPKHSNKEMKEFYRNRMYDKIEEHAVSDLKFLSDLSWKMRDLRNIAEAFSVRM